MWIAKLLTKKKINKKRTREAAGELLFCELLWKGILHKFSECSLNIFICFQHITAAFLDLS